MQLSKKTKLHIAYIVLAEIRMNEGGIMAACLDTVLKRIDETIETLDDENN